MVTSRHSIRKSTVTGNSAWEFGILQSTIEVVSTTNGVSFVWPAWSREEQVSWVAASEVVGGFTILSVTPSYEWPLFKGTSPILLFMMPSFEIVSSICPVAASRQCKFLNEWMNPWFLPKFDKSSQASNFMSFCLMRYKQTFSFASWETFRWQEPQINLIVP